MKIPVSSSFIVSYGSIFCLGLVFFLGGCGRSDRKGSGKSSSQTPPVVKDLKWCCENGDLEGVKSLLNPGNINGADDQTPPLHLAAYRGHAAIAEYLISKGAKIDKTNESLGWTPVHYAASAGQADMIEYLLQMGAKMDVVAKNGDYPIHTAAVYGHIPVIKMLMDAGALPEQESGDSWGNRDTDQMPSDIRKTMYASRKRLPIHAAASNNQANAVEFFILGGTSPNAKDSLGSNVLDYATSKRGWCEIWAKTIRLVDRDGAFERASKKAISTEGYYVTDEANPRYIRFMPEKTEIYKGSNEVGPSNRAVICTGARGGTTPSEIAKWLTPYNQKAAEQGDFVTGRYKLLGSNVALETFDGSGQNFTFSRVGDHLMLSIRSMQQEFFSESAGAGTEISCEFVSWK
jgi:hypothetical protein